MFAFLLQLGGWSYLPDFITTSALQFIHNVLPGPPPPRGSPLYVKHYKYTFAAVVLGFLTYNLIDSSWKLPPNYYELLRVDPGADEVTLKAAFRAFARKNHPDRPDVGREGEELFREVRVGYEALKDPVIRFAYERFGPDVLTWTECTTMREYLRHGLLQSSGYHIVTGLCLLLYSLFGGKTSVAFWRYLLFVIVVAVELSLLFSSPSLPDPDALFIYPSSDSHRTFLHILFPRRVAFQHIALLHQLFLFLSVAVSRVAPVIFPGATNEPDADKLALQAKAFTDRISAMAKTIDMETSGIIQTHLQTFSPRPLPLSRPPGLTPAETTEAVEALAREMENMIIERKLKLEAASGGPLRGAWEAAIRKRLALGPLLHPDAGTHPSDNDGEELKESETALPSPVSSVEGDVSKPDNDPRALPSPRPSPPLLLPGS